MLLMLSLGVLLYDYSRLLVCGLLWNSHVFLVLAVLRQDTFFAILWLIALHCHYNIFILDGLMENWFLFGGGSPVGWLGLLFLVTCSFSLLLFGLSL